MQTDVGNVYTNPDVYVIELGKSKQLNNYLPCLDAIHYTLGMVSTITDVISETSGMCGTIPDDSLYGVRNGGIL